jgi:hypothetical protein
VMKACSLEGARVFGVKKGREGFEGIETQRPPPQASRRSCSATS